MRHVHLLRFTLTRHAAPGRRELVRCYQHQSQMSPEQPVQLDRVIRQAKDYLLQSQEFSTSHSSPILDSVFVNQIDVIRSYMGKLIGSQHPILAVARDVYQERQDLYPESNFHLDGTLAHAASSAPLPSLSMGLRALIVLLVSKAIGTRQECDMMSKSAGGILSTNSLEPSFSPEVAATIADKQKKLAEVTELIYAAYMLHETIVEVPSSLPSSVLDKKVGDSSSSTEYSDINSEALRLLQDGNDLATLMGDLLLAKSSGGLASIRNQVVTELMSDSIGDFAESQFVTPFTTTTASSLNPNDLVVMTRRNERLLGHWKSSSSPSESNEIIRNIWFRRNQLGVGSLLGHSCYCSVLIGEHDENVRNLAYKLGENFGLLLQASKEVSYFLRKDPSELEKEQRLIPVRVGIYSLPVIHAVQMKALSWDALDALATKGPLCNDEYLKIYRDVQRNTRAIENSMETLCSLQDDTVKILGQLPTPSPPAVRILLDLIQGLVHPA